MCFLLFYFRRRISKEEQGAREKGVRGCGSSRKRTGSLRRKKKKEQRVFYPKKPKGSGFFF